jgi:iron complex outermembrane receptor protein
MHSVRRPSSFKARLASTAALAAAISLTLAGAAAAGEVRRTYDIAAQPMAGALTELARQSHLQLFAPQIGDGGPRRELRGDYTVQQALTILLKGSSFTYRLDGDAIYLSKPGRDQNGAPAEQAHGQSAPPPAAHDASAEGPRPLAASERGEQQETLGARVSEVVVTAQKREERLMNVPLSVSAFTDRYLESIGAAQLSDFIQQSPGVSIVDDGSGTQNIQIRGISAFAGDATVGYYIDELPFTLIDLGAVPDVRTFDVQRVEVLRGPQGTLYGDGSIGGTVRILTADANLSRFEAKTDLTLSNTEHGGASYGLKAAVNVPLIEDKVAVRLIGSYEDYGGWVDDPLLGTTDINTRQITNLRGKLRLHPTENLDVTFSAMHVSEDTGGGSSSTVDRINNRTLPPDNMVKYDLYSAVVKYAFPAFDLLSASSYIDYQQDYVFDFIGNTASDHNPATNFSQEVRLASTTPGPFQWTSGVFYRDLTTDLYLDLPPYGQQSLLSGSKSWAVFGEGSYSFWQDRAKATVGLRYFEDRRYRSQPGEPTIDATFKSTNPRFNLSFKPADNLLVYVNVAKGFRSGQTQAALALELAQLVGLDLPEAIGPETLWSYEAGAKWTSRNGRIVLETALYRNDWSDIQVPISVIPDTISGLVNAGKARVDGIDFVGSVEPVENLVFSLSAGFNKAELLEDITDITGILFAKGSRIPGVPARTISAAVDYRWDITHAGEASLRGVARADVQYNSERPAGGFGVVATSDPLALVNMRIGAEKDNWGLYLFANNVTDTNKAIDAVTTSGLATRPRPRTIGVNLRLKM